jgi:hypothetical protein
MKTRVWILVIVIGLLLVEHPAAAQRPSCTVRELIRTPYRNLMNVVFMDTEILYLSQGDLFVQALDGNTPRRLNMDLQAQVFGAEVDQTGGRVVYLQREADEVTLNLYLVSVDGSQPPLRLPNPIPDGYPYFFWLSPDGTYLAARYPIRDTLTQKIAITDLSDLTSFVIDTPLVFGGENPTAITNTHLIFAGYPSPADFTTIFDESQPIFSVPLDGSREPIRLDEPGRYLVALTATSERVVYALSQGYSDHDTFVYSTDLEGQEPPRLYEDAPRLVGDLHDTHHVWFEVDETERYLFYEGFHDFYADLVRLDVNTGEILILNSPMEPLPDTDDFVYPPEGVGWFKLYGNYVSYGFQGADYISRQYLVPMDGSAESILVNADNTVWLRGMNQAADRGLWVTIGDNHETLYYGSSVGNDLIPIATLPYQWEFYYTHFFPDGRFVYSVDSDPAGFSALYLGQCE